METLGLNEIDSYFVDVSEAIGTNHLYDFLFFNLTENGIVTDASSVIFYAYLNECKKYFIAHFHAQNESFCIEPQILKAYYLHHSVSSDQTDLFILEKSFVLYKNKELLFFKPTHQKVSTAQIRNFIEKSLQLHIDDCIEVDKNQFALYQKTFTEHFDSLKSLSCLKNNRYKEFKRFMSVVAISAVLVVFAFAYETYSQKNLTPVEEKRVTYPQKELLSLKVAQVIGNLNQYNLRVVKMDYHNEWLFLSLKHSSKGQLIEFLTHYQAEVKTLQYNAQEKVYELIVSFKLV